MLGERIRGIRRIQETSAHLREPFVLLSAYPRQHDRDMRRGTLESFE